MSSTSDTRASGRSRWPRRLMIGAIALIAIVVVVVAAFLLLTRNPRPGAFYDPPSPVVGEPGTIIRAEPFTSNVPAGARAWRVLYVSTDERDAPIAVSGLIVAPLDPPAGPQPVLAWSHGTTGIVPACAPTLSADPFKGIPDMTFALAQGWVLAMTDYPGLGTAGPHPYLVGPSQARAALDSVRAAHLLETGVELDARYAVWGHSQGGHSALFSGQLAAEYLPEYELAAVAAIAPASRLAENFSAIEGTEIGNILTIFAVESWSEYFDDVNADILAANARQSVNAIANACLNQPSQFRIVVAGVRLPDQVTTVDVTTDPVWKAHMTANSPDPAGVVAPLFVAQGLTDNVVAPSVTERWVSDRCAAGAAVDYRTYPDLTHNGVVLPGGADALAWTIDRFAGKPATNTCP